MAGGLLESRELEKKQEGDSLATSVRLLDRLVACLVAFIQGINGLVWHLPCRKKDESPIEPLGITAC